MEHRKPTRPSRWAWAAIGGCVAASIVQIPFELGHPGTGSLSAVAAPILRDAPEAPAQSDAGGPNRTTSETALQSADSAPLLEAGAARVLTRLGLAAPAHTPRHPKPAGHKASHVAELLLTAATGLALSPTDSGLTDSGSTDSGAEAAS